MQDGNLTMSIAMLLKNFIPQPYCLKNLRMTSVTKDVMYVDPLV